LKLVLNSSEAAKEITNSGKCYDKSFIDDYLQENDWFDKDILISADFNVIPRNGAMKAQPLSKGAHNLLNKHTEVWQKIYELVKYPPIIKTQRDENKMLAVIKAIVYKHETNCKWVDLPKWAPSVGQVYYYYSEAKRRNLLDNIITLSAQADNQIAKLSP